MNEIEKIKRYVAKNTIPNGSKYDLDIVDGFELSKAAHENKDLPLEIIVLAFNYGRAKGYRAAKAEEKARAAAV